MDWTGLIKHGLINHGLITVHYVCRNADLNFDTGCGNDYKQIHFFK